MRSFLAGGGLFGVGGVLIGGSVLCVTGVTEGTSPLVCVFLAGFSPDKGRTGVSGDAGLVGFSASRATGIAATVTRDPEVPNEEVEVDVDGEEKGLNIFALGTFGRGRNVFVGGMGTRAP